MADQPGPRAAFDSLLAKTHVQHALLQPGGQYNDIPPALATLFLLDGTPCQLQAACDSMKGHLAPWEPSPGSIADEETKSRLLGDTRFQRAFMSYFSMENGRFGGNSKALSISHLFTGDKPLIYGLFSGVGRPLALLSDGIELRAAILVVESLTLSAVDWMAPMWELLTDAQLEAAAPPCELRSPENIISRLAYDGRFSGLMKSGPGFPRGLPHIFASPSARAALVEYVRCLDCRGADPARLLLPQLSALAVLLLCATHKPDGPPAFDLYLGRLVTCVNSARVVLDGLLSEEHSDGRHGVLLVRGLWLLVLLTYVTQLRPVVDGRLLVSDELPGPDGGWEALFAGFRGRADLDGKYGYFDFLRALRSLWELSKAYSGLHRELYLRAAWKLVSTWQGWTGLGVDREVLLNIRL